MTPTKRPGIIRAYMESHSTTPATTIAANGSDTSSLPIVWFWFFLSLTVIYIGFLIVENAARSNKYKKNNMNDILRKQAVKSLLQRKIIKKKMEREKKLNENAQNPSNSSGDTSFNNRRVERSRSPTTRLDMPDDLQEPLLPQPSPDPQKEFSGSRVKRKSSSRSNRPPSLPPISSSKQKDSSAVTVQRESSISRSMRASSLQQPERPFLESVPQRETSFSHSVRKTSSSRSILRDSFSSLEKPRGNGQIESIYDLSSEYDDLDYLQFTDNEIDIIAKQSKLRTQLDIKPFNWVSSLSQFYLLLINRAGSFCGIMTVFLFVYYILPPWLSEEGIYTELVPAKFLAL